MYKRTVMKAEERRKECNLRKAERNKSWGKWKGINTGGKRKEFQLSERERNKSWGKEKGIKALG